MSVRNLNRLIDYVEGFVYSDVLWIAVAVGVVLVAIGAFK